MSTKTLVVFKIWILENGDITWKRSIYAAIWIQITVQTVDMLGGNLSSLTLCLSPDVCWENTGHAENLR